MLGLGRGHLIGFSWGADIVLRLAVDHPELVRTLVVTEPGLFSWLTALPGGPELFAEYANTMIPAKSAAQDGDYERGLRLFIDAVLGEDQYDQLPPSAQERLMVNRRLISAEVTDLREVVTDITREEASKIQAPTLILTGEESPEISLLVSQELRRCMPDADHALIGEAAHLLHVMNPQAYNSTVLAFLARHTK
jgi:pimeloyl-ACP methyl ester carboxylesterase